MRLLLLFASAGILGLPGCATLLSGPTQAINIQSDPSGAECSINRFTIATPGVVVLERAGGDYAVSCELAGYKTAKATITYRANPNIIGDVFTGILPGLFTDLMSGAIWNLQPDVINVKLKKDGAK